MYWNQSGLTQWRWRAMWLIETWDVLKYEFFCHLARRMCKINRNMRCIEIQTKELFIHHPERINRNMRCIEMCFRNHASRVFMINRNMRCIEMRQCNERRRGRRLINRNMRCIEITSGHKPEFCNPINRNMRCIEILFPLATVFEIPWLIETWDVLKSSSILRYHI